MTNKVSRIAIICALEEAIRDEVKRMCDTDCLAELDTMALHAKENIKILQSVKYKSLVKESTEVVKGLAKDEPQTEKLPLHVVFEMALDECKRKHKGCENCDIDCMWRDKPQTEREGE